MRSCCVIWTRCCWSRATTLQGIKAEPRLTLREKDAGFFREYVQENNLEGLFALKDTELTLQRAAQHL